MPFLYEKIDDETELLLPDNLLHSDSLIRKLVNEMDEEDWQDSQLGVGSKGRFPRAAGPAQSKSNAARRSGRR
ncbi:MAG: hypothetical protein U0935_08460 [Pirellulales bacterium]